MEGMGKKRFLELIQLASQPLPRAKGTSTRADDYSGKQILKRINEGSKAKLREKSRPKSALTGRKSPRRGSS